MPRFSAPITTLAGLAVICIIATGCAGSGAAAAPARATTAPWATATRRPSTVTLTGGVGAGSYKADTTSSLDVCTKAPDGSWRLLYGGGTPFVELDLLVGPKAGQPDGANQAAARDRTPGRATSGSTQRIMRGGDRKGRSTATIAVASTAEATTFKVTATTPDVAADDIGTVDVDLTVTCPNPS